ncbi:MAG: hypothetical protein ACK44D_08530 [Bacteroidia bacterium]
MKTTFLICSTTLTSFVVNAQNDGTKNLRGRFFVGGIDGGHYFRIEARENTTTGETTSDNSENHTFSTYLGYGFHYGTNKAITFELSQTVRNSDFPSYKYWHNTYGFSFGKMKLKNVYQNEWFVLSNQRLGYNYGLSREYIKPGFPEYTSSPPSYSHTLFYGLAIGALYKPNNSISYRLTIPLFNVGIGRSERYSNVLNSYEEVTNYYYNTSFLYSITNLQLSVLWSPNFIQSKKNK